MSKISEAYRQRIQAEVRNSIERSIKGQWTQFHNDTWTVFVSAHIDECQAKDYEGNPIAWNEFVQEYSEWKAVGFTSDFILKDLI